MAEGFSLGKAFVTVSPDTEGFKDELKAKLDADKTEVKVKVTPDTTDFKARLDKALATARNAKVSIKTDANTAAFSTKIDEVVKKASAKQANVKVDANTKDFDAQMDLLTKRPRSTTVTVKYDKSQLSALGADAGGVFTKGFDDSVGGSGGGGMSLSAANPYLAGGGIAAGVTAALAVLPGAMAALGSVSGIALGGAIVAMAESRITTLNKQISTLQTSLASVKPGAKLTPQQQSKEDLLQADQQSMQQLQMFDKINNQIQMLKTNGEDALFQGVKPLLSYFSQGLSSISQFLPQLTRDLQGFFSAVGPSVMPLVQDLEYLVNTILPAFTGMLKNNQGAVTSFYSGLGALINGIGQFIKNLGPGVGASMQVVVGLFEDLAQVLGGLGSIAANVANTFGGTIIKAFSGLTTLLMTVVKWVGQIGGSLMPLIATLAPVLSNIINAAMPILLPILQQLVGIVDNLITQLSPFLVALLNGLKPILPIVLQVVGAFGQFAETILGSLIAALTPLIPVLSQILEALLKPLAALLGNNLNVEGKIFAAIIQALAPSLLLLAQSVANLLIALEPLLLLFTKLVAWVTQFAAVILIKVIQAIGVFIQWIMQLVEWVTAGIRIFSQWVSSIQNWHGVWSAVVNFLHSTWSGLVNALHVSWSAMTNFVTGVWHGIENVTKSVWNGIRNFLRGIWQGAMNELHKYWSPSVTWAWVASIWNHMLSDAHRIWSAIVNWLHSTWSNAVNFLHRTFQPEINWVRNVWNSIKNVTVEVWNSVASWLGSKWNSIVRALRSIFSPVVNWLKGIWNDISRDAKSVWNSLTGWLGGLWNREVSGLKNIWNGARNWLKGIWNSIKNDASSAWRAIANAVHSAWNAVVNGVEAPIRLVVQGVDKFDALINHIPGVHLPTNLRFAGGGVVPGYAPGRDVVNAKLSPGEGILVPEATKALGGAAGIRAINSKFSNRPDGTGGNSFAGGGVWNDLKNAGAAIASGASNLWNDTKDLISDPAKFIEAHAKSMLLSGLKAGTLGTDIITGAINTMINAIKTTAQQAFASSVSYNASAGVRQWLPDVLKALALNGLPSSLANQVLRQISTESGGNPNAVNLTDINAQEGHPSQGLLQTIPSTFQAYHIPGTSENIRDPLANIAAAINYAKHVYGPSLMRGGNGLGSGHGYALGGNPMAGEWATVGENGPELAYFGKNAHVFTNKQSAAMAGGVHFHEGSIVINGKMNSQDVQTLKRQLADAVSGFNI